MWTSDEFIAHLEDIGHGKVWEDKIYPGMREIINQVCKCGQESIPDRKNSFELYGADFILDEDYRLHCSLMLDICIHIHDNYRPWVIEINSCPSLSKSTPATEKLVSSCLRDIVKLTVDRRANRKADIVSY